MTNKKSTDERNLVFADSFLKASGMLMGSANQDMDSNVGLMLPAIVNELLLVRCA
jgi:hypothetical protein